MEGIDLSAIRLFITTLIRDAGDILLKHFYNSKLVVVEKSGVDFTTEADMAADLFIKDQLRKNFPSDMILTEESVTGSDFSAYAEADQCWIVDPLDGTTNFSRGDSNFSISIALVRKSVPVFGMVYLPTKRKLYWAHADQDGAYVNGKHKTRLKVSQTAELRQMVVACDWPWDLAAREVMADHLRRIAPRVRAIKSMGSACADLCKMAEGKVDAYIHTGLKPWDVAAAGLICQKAGAFVRPIENRVIVPWNPFDQTIFVANNFQTETALMDLMFGPIVLRR